MKTKLLCIVCILALVLTMVACKQDPPNLPMPTDEQVSELSTAVTQAMMNAAAQKINSTAPAGYNHTIAGGKINQTFNNSTITYSRSGVSVTVTVTGTSVIRLSDSGEDFEDIERIDMSAFTLNSQTWTLGYDGTKTFINGHDVTAILASD